MSTVPPPRLIRFLTGFMAVGIGVRVFSGLMLSGTDLRLALLFLQHAGAAAGIFLLLKCRKFEAGIFFMGLEFAVLSTRLVWLFGTGPLFHIHGLVLAPVALLLTHFPRRKRILYVVLPMILTLLVALIPRGHDPAFPLPSNLTDIWSLVNLALFMSACMGIILYQIQALEEQTTRAEHLAAQRSRLITDLSHEWKTPLAAILAKIQATLSRPREPQSYREALALCERNAQHLKAMTLRMVEYQQAEQHHLTPRMESVDLPRLLNGLIEELSPLAEEKGFTLELNTPETLHMETDPLLLGLLLRNLVANALQHAIGGNHIRIIAKTGPSPTIRIEDNGPGIPEARLDDLFEPFVRGDTARRREDGSVGLGLAIARETAKALGTELEAGNQAKGGAVFRVIRKN
jgi:signal transduction histidine kinase